MMLFFYNLSKIKLFNCSKYFFHFVFFIPHLLILKKFDIVNWTSHTTTISTFKWRNSQVKFCVNCWPPYSSRKTGTRSSLQSVEWSFITNNIIQESQVQIFEEFQASLRSCPRLEELKLIGHRYDYGVLDLDFTEHFQLQYTEVGLKVFKYYTFIMISASTGRMLMNVFWRRTAEEKNKTNFPFP